MARSVDLVARLIADTKDFRRGIAEVDTLTRNQVNQLRRVGRTTEQLGRNMTRNITLPLLAIGGAAVKTFTDFETSISKIGGLVLGTTEGLDDIREGVLDLAGETTKAPQELAEAMFAIQSAGLRGSVAMDTLEIAAKGSAAGLGETRDVALAATSAMTAYQRVGLTAVEATDILAATVREGNLAADELAGSLGRVIPVASAAGVPLEDVGAAIALITRTGASASEATTQVASAIKQLNAPTRETVPLIEEAFGSLDNFRGVLQEQGLLEAFRQLEDRFGAQPEKLRRILGSAEALNAVLAITGQEAGEVDRVFSELGDSSGSVETAFEIFGQTPGAEFQQAISDLQTSLIEFGEVAAPVVSDIAGGVAGIARRFGELPQPIQTGIVAFAGIAAVSGPILTVVGRLTQLRSRLMGLGRLGQTAAAGIGALGKASLVAGIVLMADTVIDKISEIGDIDFDLEPLRRDIANFVNEGIVSGELLDLAGDDFSKFGSALNRIVEPGVADRVQDVTKKISSLGGLLGRSTNREFRDAQERLSAIDEVMSNLVSGGNLDAAAILFDTLDTAASDVGVSTDELLNVLPEYSSALAGTEADATLAGDAASGAAGGIGEVADAGQAAADALEDFNDELGLLLDNFDGLTSETDDVFDAIENLVDEVKGNKEEFGALGVALEGNSSAARDNRDAVNDVARAVTDFASEAVRRGEDVDIVSGRFADFRESLLANADALGINKDELAPLVALINEIEGETIAQLRLEVTGLEEVDRVLETLGSGTIALPGGGRVQISNGEVVGLAHGGLALPGQTYRVGEVRPELITPLVPSMVTPFAPPSADSASTTFINENHFHGRTDAETAAAAGARKLRESAFLMGV